MVLASIVVVSCDAIMKRTTDEAITPAAYRAFQGAYDFFNAELFGGPCLTCW